MARCVRSVAARRDISASAAAELDLSVEVDAEMEGVRGWCAPNASAKSEVRARRINRARAGEPGAGMPRPLPRLVEAEAGAEGGRRRYERKMRFSSSRVS